MVESSSFTSTGDVVEFVTFCDFSMRCLVALSHPGPVVRHVRKMFNP